MENNGSSSTADRLRWILANSPPGRSGGLGALLAAIGGPGGPGGSGGSFGSFGSGGVWQNAYMDQIRRGQNPYENLPWLNGDWGGSGSTGGSTGGSSGAPAGGSTAPAWWQDWYNSSGKYGGLLDE